MPPKLSSLELLCVCSNCFALLAQYSAPAAFLPSVAARLGCSSVGVGCIFAANSVAVCLV